MKLKNGRQIDDHTVDGFRNNLTGQIFKLIPLREEGAEWEKHLDSVLLEFMGADEAFVTINFCRIISKLSILKFLSLEWERYRKTVFEAISLMEKLDWTEEDNIVEGD